MKIITDVFHSHAFLLFSPPRCDLPEFFHDEWKLECMSAKGEEQEVGCGMCGRVPCKLCITDSVRPAPTPKFEQFGVMLDWPIGTAARFIVRPSMCISRVKYAV